MFKDDGQER